MPARYPITFGQRQAGLGPPAEMTFVPFPFEELASGIGKQQAQKADKVTADGTKDLQEGLININAYGQDFPVFDQQVLNNTFQSKQVERDELASKILENPNNPILQQDILNFKRKYSNEELYGNTAKVLRAKKQVEEADKEILKRDLNPWDTLELQNEVFNYYADQQEGKVSELDLTGALARTPNKKYDRFGNISNALEGMAANDIADISSYLRGYKEDGSPLLNVIETENGNFLSKVSGKGFSDIRVNNTIVPLLNSAEFSADIRRQLDYEERQSLLSNIPFDKKARYKEIVNDGLLAHAIAKKAAYTLEPSITELKESEGKEGLFGGAFLKSTVAPIGIFDVKMPEISSRDKFYFDSSGKLNHDAVNEMINLKIKEIASLKGAKYHEKEDIRQIARAEAEILHLKSLTDNILKLREDHKVLSDKYESDRQFINAVKTATNASDEFKYDAVIPQIQILSKTMWELASANPLVWGIKDESTGEIVEDSADIERGEAAFSLDPIGNKSVFQVGNKIYSSQLPDPLVSVFGTVKNITEGIQQSLNTDKIIEIQPFIKLGNNKIVKIARTLEDGEYKIKVKYDEHIGYIDVQTYLSLYIEELTPQINKIGKEMVKGASFK